MQNTIFWIAAAILLLSAAGSLASVVLFLVNLRIPISGPVAGIVLVLPATGSLDNFENLLAALGRQSVRARRLIIAVESPDDPAYRRVTELAKTRREPAIDVVVAGVSNRRGQKCTNIFAALNCLATEDRFIVMLDADIRPQPWWLGALVAPLAAGRSDLVSGYRWLVPRPLTLASVLVAHIDRAVAVLPRIAPGIVWGGSLALTREALETLDLASTLDREVVEDAPIGIRLTKTGLRLLTRRALRVPTPLSGSWRELWAFGRRQGQFVRLYCPRLWCCANLVATADLLARAMLAWDLFATGSMPALRVLALIAASGSVATELRCAVGRRIGAPDSLACTIYQHVLNWAIFPIGAWYVSFLWASAFTSVVRWAHVQYSLDRSGRVLAVRRHPYAS
ncbi:MAG: glycosyltransferase family 2 protein [Alphaproteobacteria bacterium]|nr:glycosyltransferase family 2 protein [Alphaproteobacteria bacterium]